MRVGGLDRLVTLDALLPARPAWTHEPPVEAARADLRLAALRDAA